MTKRQITIVSIIVFVVILIMSSILFFTYPRMKIQATYTKPIEVQLFYDKGDGLNEQDSITKKVTRPQQTSRFRLPDEDILTFRIDFGEQPNEIVIDNITIQHIGRKIVLQGQEIREAFNSSSQLNRESIKNGQYIIDSSMLDPYILNTTGELGINAGSRTWQTLQKVIIRLIILSSFFLIYLITLLCYGKRNGLSENKISLKLLAKKFKNQISKYKAKKKLLIALSAIITGVFINIATGTLVFNNIIDSLISIFDLLMVIILSFITIVLLLQIEINIRFQTISKKEWIIYSVIIFLFLIIFFIAYYPAGMTSDSINQWKQVTRRQYNDWHPAAHTFIFMRLPSLVWQNPASATIMQMLFISICMGYVAYSLRCWGLSKKVVILFLVLYMIHPSNQRISITLWKDVSYSFSLLIFSVMCMWIYFTDGKWIQSKKHMVAFCIVSLGVLLMRHNGILSFVPAMICLIMVYKQYRKTFGIIGIALLIFKFVLTGPIYQLLGVQSHNQSFAEAMGIPNNQISHIISNDGEINDEQWDFINQIAPIEQWKANYYPDTINPLKWAADENQHLYFDAMFIEENRIEYLKTWANLVGNNFGLAVESYYYVTHIIWDFEVRYDGTERMVEPEEIKPSSMLQPKGALHEKVYEYITWCENGWFKILTPSVGLAFFLMNIAIFCAMAKDKKKIVPYVVFLCNTIGMMLLMTGGVARYTYVNIIGWFPVVIFSLLSYNSGGIIKREVNELTEIKQI